MVLPRTDESTRHGRRLCGTSQNTHFEWILSAARQLSHAANLMMVVGGEWIVYSLLYCFVQPCPKFPAHQVSLTGIRPETADGFCVPMEVGLMLEDIHYIQSKLLIGTPFSLNTPWSNRWPSHKDESKLHLVFQSTDAHAHITDQQLGHDPKLRTLQELDIRWY